MSDNSVIKQLEQTSLRKRSGRSETRTTNRGVRERSKEPPILRRTDGSSRLSPIIETDAIWDEFKEVVATEFPDVSFPDEYMEENGVVTATIQGAHYAEVGRIMALARGAMKVDVYESKLVATMDTNKYSQVCKQTQQEVKTVTKKGFFVYRVTTNPKFWVVLLWGLALGATIRFIVHNQENYMKLL